MRHLKFRYLWLGLFIGITFGVLSGARADEAVLHRIGIDANGAAVDEPVEASAYTGEFQAIVGSVSDTSLEVLNRPATKKQWKLTTLVVGVGVGMEFGVGPVLKIKATPRLRVLFSRNDDPVIP